MKKSVMDFDQVTITYQNASRPAADHISFSVPESSIVCIVGESGSGKSTLIRSVLGLLPEQETTVCGRILFGGQDLLAMKEKQLRALSGSQIAMIFQNAGQYLDGRRRIGSQFAESIRCHRAVTKAEALQQAAEMLTALRLPDPQHILQSYPFELSGGMCQRVAIAMAMVMQPKLLLADEPTSALDVTMQAQVVQLMMQLRETYATTILMVTHHLGVASFMADYIAVMKTGQLVEFGTRDQVIEEPQQEYTKLLLEAVPELDPGEVPPYETAGESGAGEECAMHD